MKGHKSPRSVLTPHSCLGQTAGDRRRHGLCLRFTRISSAINPRLSPTTAGEARRPGLGFPDLLTGVILEDTVQKANQTPLLAEKKRSPTPSPEVVGYQHLPTFGMWSKLVFIARKP